MSIKVNYQLELDKIIESIVENKKDPPKLLLHSCCAPCSSYVLEYLSQYFSITVFFYNPNINTEEEYIYRLKEQKRFINEFNSVNPINFIDGDYDTKLFLNTVQGLEDEPERGKRCIKCFELRLNKTAQTAKELSFDYFATTLTLSPLKDAVVINNLGNSLSQKYGISYLCSDFKKKNGYKRSIELSKEYNLYRQNYCGCKFSLR